MNRLLTLFSFLSACIFTNAQNDSIRQNTIDNLSYRADTAQYNMGGWHDPWLRDAWFIQVGGDWTIQKPYNHPVSGMIKNGSSLGVDVALGKWFTHELGLRGKFSWGNGLIDCKANWLAPFDQPGENHKRGGFISMVGDVLWDLHNTIGGYKPERKWNAGLFLRAGAAYNFGCDKGTPLIGLGVFNQYRLSDHWGLYGDIAYNGISSGFSMDKSTETGTGSGSNMYFTVDVGVTYNIGGEKHKLKDDITLNRFKDNTFWKNWFLQFGADMTLYNPCSRNFAEVFPKGTAMGLDIAMGKWFSPKIGVRGKLNFENFLIENKKFEWLSYDPEYTSNYDGGGCMMMYFDALVSAKHILKGYQRGEKWDCYCFGRMGLSKNKAIDSLSPVVGLGIGTTYRINKFWSIYGDTAYEGTTSEFFDGISWSGSKGAAFNAIWDFNLGVQLNIGNFGW